MKIRKRICLGLLVAAGFTQIAIGQEPAIPAAMSVEVSRVVRLNDSLEIDVKIVNGGNRSIFAVVDPRTSTGKNTLLLSTDPDSKILHLSSRFYADPKSFFIPVDAAGADLRELAPKELVQMQFTLRFPLSPTEPPYDRAPMGGEIRLNDLTSVIFEMGFLPDGEGIRRVIGQKKSSKLVSKYFSGMENISSSPDKGRILVEFQSVVSASHVIESSH